MEPLLILTNVPDRPTAEKLASAVVASGAAACVNVLATCHSIYRWQGAVETAEEIPLLIKTTTSAYSRLEEIIRSLHPYDLPEIIAVPITNGLPAYLAWVAQETEEDE
jgi:periplasmic divalent cation tolerance protein